MNIETLKNHFVHDQSCPVTKKLLVTMKNLKLKCTRRDGHSEIIEMSKHHFAHNQSHPVTKNHW